MASQRHTSAVADEGAPAPDRDIPEPVLAATRACVLAVGVRRTTLTDVARRAGVSRMTVYRLVPDVATLILEVVTREFAALLDDAESSARRRRSVRGRVVATTVEVIRRLPETELFRRILDVDPELLLPYLTDRLGSTQQIAVGHLRRMLAEGVADGSVRRGDVDILALTMVMAVTPFVVSAWLIEDDRREAVLVELSSMLESWLRP